MSPTWGEYLFFEISEGEHFPLCRCFSSSLLVIIVFTSPGGGGLPQLTTLLNTPLDILKVMLSLIRRVFYYMNGAIMKWTLYNVPVCKPGKIWRDWLARYECMESDFISIWCFCKEWNVLHKPLKLRKTWFSLAKLIADAIQSLQVLTQKLLLETKAKAIV